MSRFVLGNCIDVIARIPDNAIDFILTDPPYLVGFRDRSGRTIAGDKTDEWLQPACNEMYRVLKKDALMVSFYGWNRVDRFVAAWKNAGFSVVGHLVFTKNYTSKAAYVGYRHECAYILAKGRPRLPQNPLLRLSRKRGNSSALSLSRNHSRRPVRKKVAQKRKAVDVRPRSRSLSCNRRRVTITGFQTISRSDRADCDNRPAPFCAGHHRRDENERIFQNTSGAA